MMYKIIVQNVQNQEFACSSEEDLLAQAVRSRVPITAACRGGGCGVCKIKVVEGQFERGKYSKRALTDEESKQNFSLACKTFPNSDMVIEIVPKKNKFLS